MQRRPYLLPPQHPPMKFLNPQKQATAAHCTERAIGEKCYKMLRMTRLRCQSLQNKKN